MHFIFEYFRKNYILALCENAVHTNIFTLNLSRFDIKEVPEVIEQCTLLRLFLNNNQLKQVPSLIGNMEHLQVLTLDYNKLESFPVCICNLINLKQLNVSNNDIKELPCDIGNLTMMETFWCNNTGLKFIPEEIGNWELLETLGARGNRIAQLPETAMGRLTKLRWLTLEMNELNEIPKTFTALKNLKHLNLKDNQFTRFPKIFRTMKKLQFLFLNCNQIKRLPTNDVLEECHFMKMLNLSNNPFDNIGYVINKVQQHQYIVYNDVSAKYAHDDDGDNDDDFSDWENSIGTSDIDSTDESSPEYELEDISVLIPEISRYVTNFC